MGKRRRSDLPDGYFHVIGHAVAANVLFRDDLDRRLYLAYLEQAVERYDVGVLTFALLDNHLHALVHAEVGDLSSAFWFCHGRYATRHNIRHERRGHLFERRFTSIPILIERHLYAAVRYIARNPVEAGMCERAQDHAWSADGAIAGVAPVPAFLRVDDVRALWGGGSRALREYRAFVDGEDPPEHDVVVRYVTAATSRRPELTDLLAHGTTGLVDAYDRWGYTLAEIGAALNIHHSTAHRRLARARAGRSRTK